MRFNQDLTNDDFKMDQSYNSNDAHEIARGSVNKVDKLSFNIGKDKE